MTTVKEILLKRAKKIPLSTESGGNVNISVNYYTPQKEKNQVKNQKINQVNFSRNGGVWK